MAAILTTAREAIWRAIDNDGALKVLHKKFKFDDHGALQKGFNPSLGEMPALSLFPAEGGDAWRTNQMRKTEYALQAQLWTPNVDLRAAEDLWEKVCRAVWHNRPSAAALEYWRGPDATPTVNVRMEGLSMTPVALEESPTAPMAMLTTWRIVLELNWNPRL